jgi:phosphate-selective porin OprO/OprP
MKRSLYAAGLLLLVGSAQASTSATEDDKKKTTEERLMTLEEEVARLRAASKESDGSIQASFEGGKFKFQSADGNFSAQLGGRIQFDVGSIDEDSDWATSVGGKQPDGAEIRRGRLYMSGTLMKAFDYKWQVDFAGTSAPNFKDFYVAFKESPVGRIQGGQFKEPFGIEQLTSSNYISTMERSAVSEAFARSRNLGLQVSNHTESENVQWALGFFKQDPTGGGISFTDGGHNVTARVSTAVVHEDDGEHVLHLGGQYRKSDDFAGVTRYRARGSGSHLLSARAVDTGNISSDGADEWGVEAAWVKGPLSLQAEYMMASVDAVGMSDPDFGGWYGLVSYFLTGETRPYKARSGAFSRVRPHHDYGNSNGAWEVVGRYSTIDLDDAGVTGGELDDYTLGVNWYLSPNTRIMLNWSTAELGGSRDGTANVLQARWQLDF